LFIGLVIPGLIEGSLRSRSSSDERAILTFQLFDMQILHFVQDEKFDCVFVISSTSEKSNVIRLRSLASTYDMKRCCLFYI
jgi:hypothetical protein